MKLVYPVVFTKTKKHWLAHVPDFPADTQGDDMADAIVMARDAIGMLCLVLQDDGKPLPAPSAIKDVPCGDDDVVSLVDIDLDAYRRAHDQRTVRRNVTLPSWLDDKASKSGINVSAVLQSALIEKLEGV